MAFSVRRVHQVIWFLHSGCATLRDMKTWTDTRRRQLKINLVVLAVLAFAGLNAHFWHSETLTLVTNFLTFWYAMFSNVVCMFLLLAIWYMETVQTVPARAGRKTFYDAMKTSYRDWSITWDYVLAWVHGPLIYLSGFPKLGLTMSLFTVVFVLLNFHYKRLIDNLILDDDLKAHQ